MPTPPLPRGVLELAVVNTLCFVSIAVFTPVLDVLVRERFDTDAGGTAAFMAASGVSSLVFYVVAGLWSDRIGRRLPLIVVGLIGSGITTAATPHFTHFPSLLGWRVLDGALSAMSLGLVLVRATDLAGPENRNRAMGVMSIAISAGFLIAPALASVIENLEVLFGLVGGALVLSGGWLARGLGAPETIVSHRPGLREAGAALAASPALLVPVAFSFVEKFTFGTMGHLTSLAVKDLHGGGQRESAWPLLGFWLAFTIFCVPGARLCDRRGALPTMAAGATLYGLSLAGLGLMDFGGFVALMTVAGIFCAIQYVPSVSLVGEFAPPAHRGAAMGIWNTAGSLGIVMGMVISGKLSERSYALAYGVSGGAAFLAGATGMMLAWRRARAARAGAVPDGAD